MGTTRQIAPGRLCDTRDLRGMFLAWYIEHDQPVMIDFGGTKVVPLFDTELSLESVMKHIGVTQYRMKRVDDGPNFVASIMEQGYDCAFNVHVAPNPGGGIAPLRYTLVTCLPGNMQ